MNIYILEENLSKILPVNCKFIRDDFSSILSDKTRTSRNCNLVLSAKKKGENYFASLEFSSSLLVENTAIK